MQRKGPLRMVPHGCDAIRDTIQLRRSYGMKKRKTLRSRCSNEFYKKQFRHADPAAEFCSSPCRQAVYRIRHKAKKEAARSEEYERILAAVRKRREAERQGAERERSAPEPSERNVEEQRRPSEPAEAAPRHLPGYIPAYGVVDDPPPRGLAITRPRRPPLTPLGRGR